MCGGASVAFAAFDCRAVSGDIPRPLTPYGPPFLEQAMCYVNGLLFILALLFAVFNGGTFPTV